LSIVDRTAPKQRVLAQNPVARHAAIAVMEDARLLGARLEYGATGAQTQTR